ncbi:MAG: arylsulfatase, partial [Selenomonas sp.]|nr:arylsulfatase [Selenomonas sp.]
ALPEGLDGNLPAAFGGRKREYCISNAMFPKQTYKLRLRMKNCQMDMESKSLVYQDGTVDLTGAHLWASRRDGRPGGVTNTELSRMLEIVREHTASFDNMGIQWPMLQGEVL